MLKSISSTKELRCRNEKMVIEVDRREKNVSFTNSQSIASLNHDKVVKLNGIEPLRRRWILFESHPLNQLLVQDLFQVEVYK